MRRELPSGTVTFLFTDVEGSTKLLHEQGAENYAAALMEHRRSLREAFMANGGVEVDTQGDAFFVAFPTASGALRAAADAQERLSRGPIRVRMGLHTGTPHLTEEGYVGADVHRAARIAACGHGGQTLVSFATAGLIDPAGLRDLGLHRLKDLSAPERIYQLGDEDFPPLRSLHQTNLPIASTPFLGRAKELAQVLALLARDGVRLLTLTGPGGTGKSRLAAQAAAELAGRYPGGVWWVALAALRDPALVLETVGKAIGAKDGVVEHIADRSMLILFDNFEQVVEAAPDVAGLLGSCPNLRLLVTSRERLRVTGEQEYPVPILAHEDALQLFLSRARAVKPDFRSDDAVAEICRRLDQLPLAIELAAARVRALSSRQILDRLAQRLPLLTGGARDVPERQRTLHAAIAWSHELLTPEEARAFARLAVFRGGCALEAVEEVTQADFETLQSLVDKSLVRHAEDRFWMLETIREYSLEKLERSGEELELRRRHAEHYLLLAEQAEPHLWASSVEWLDRLEQEHDNVRSALDLLLASGETQSALQLAGAVSRFWYLRSHFVEGRRRLDSGLRADDRPTAARAKALVGASVMHFNLGELPAAKERVEEAFALNQTLGNASALAYCKLMLGNIVSEEGDHERARQLYEESANAFRELGEEHLALTATTNLAWAYSQLGDGARAHALYQDSLDRARALHNWRVEAQSLGSLGSSLVLTGEAEDGFGMLRASLRLRHDHGDLLWMAIDLRRLAHGLALQGHPARAANLLAKGLTVLGEVGARFSWTDEWDQKTITIIRADLGEAAFAEAWERGRTMTIDEAIALALDPST